MVLSLEKGWLTELLARVGRAAGRAALRHRAIEAILDVSDYSKERNEGYCGA